MEACPNIGTGRGGILAGLAQTLVQTLVMALLIFRGRLWSA
jgi:hypothetical protein